MAGGGEEARIVEVVGHHARAAEALPGLPRVEVAQGHLGPPVGSGDEAGVGEVFLFMPFSSPNVTSTVFDISLPEVRSSAQAVEYFIENSGAALAPTLAGAIILTTGSKQYAIM